LKKPRKILIIVQRSNGDVFLSLSLIKVLQTKYESAKIDLLINEDTLSVAKLFPRINCIHTFSYSKKQNDRFDQEKNLIIKLFKKYDLSINLTSSDRSVIYALLFGKKSISAIESNIKKSWWKMLFLTHYYYFDNSKHILLNNLEPLNLLNIKHDNIQEKLDFNDFEILSCKDKLKLNKIKQFLVFHPSAQYKYKVYPKKLRDNLLHLLNTLEIPILVTGSNSTLDLEIKKEIPDLSNIYNLIGDTSLKDFFMLSELSIGYIGMDTLNMHVAASQNKRIFAIYGPTNLSMWSPWSNELKHSTSTNKPSQTYGKNTIFQANMSCVACGNAGCDDKHGRSECLYLISPKVIFDEINDWLSNV